MKLFCKQNLKGRDTTSTQDRNTDFVCYSYTTTVCAFAVIHVPEFVAVDSTDEYVVVDCDE